MSTIYAAFLKAPSGDQLAADAALTYVPTTTIINGQTAIIKHFSALAKQVVKEKENTLDTIESRNGLFVEVETTLAFKNSGGVFLPGIDGDLLDEKRVTIPITHVVRFDSQQKIQQIRIYWDQGTMLKQAELVGRSGRNWPVRDGSAQIDAINQSVRAAQSSKITEPVPPRDVKEIAVDRHRKQDSVSATKDPHASLALFSPGDRSENTEPRLLQAFHARQGSSVRPAADRYDDLFVGEESAARNPDTATFSPTKAGAGSHFKENRLFKDDSEDMLQSPERKKTFDQKYTHFSFDGEGDSKDSRTHASRGGKGAKNQATFSFEDFSTPAKPEHKTRPEYERHWGPNDNEDYPPSPPKRPIVHQPRPDAATHYELAERTPKPEEIPTLKTATGINNSRRADDFAAHYAIADKSPSNGAAQQPRGAARHDQDLHWGFSTPVADKKIYKTAGDGMGGRSLDIFGADEPIKGGKIFKTAGDGMGGRGARKWGFGDDSDPEIEHDPHVSARSRRAKAQADASDDF